MWDEALHVVDVQKVILQRARIAAKRPGSYPAGGRFRNYVVDCDHGTSNATVFVVGCQVLALILTIQEARMDILVACAAVALSAVVCIVAAQVLLLVACGLCMRYELWRFRRNLCKHWHMPSKNTKLRRLARG